MGVLFAEERKHYHERLLQEGILTIDKNGVPSNADKASKLSVRIAAGIAERLMAGEDEKSVGQTSGAKFEQINMEFLAATFPKLQHLRPGEWTITKLGNRNAIFCSLKKCQGQAPQQQGQTSGPIAGSSTIEYLEKIQFAQRLPSCFMKGAAVLIFCTFLFYPETRNRPLVPP